MPSSQPQETPADRIYNLVANEKWAFAWMPQCGIAVVVGMASNQLCAAIVQKTVYTFAVSADHSLLHLLKEGNATLWPVEALLPKLPFPSGSVDAVVVVGALEYAVDEKQVVNEVQRIMRPGGKLILSVPYKGLFRFPHPTQSHNMSPAIRHRYSDADLTRLLFLRFRILQQHYGGLLLYPLAVTLDNFLQKTLRQDWSRLFNKIRDFDNDVSWGRWSYNLIMLAEKI